MAPQQYKLKYNPVEVEKPGSKVEAEVEGVTDCKVLLVNVKGDLKAISPRCTHYGAPLVKGVLTSDGRITCPWHGACFNTSTGDIEDAPALDPLVPFKCTHKDGGVYIEAEEAALKAGRRLPKSAAVAEAITPNDHVLVVGGGAGGLGAVEGLREGGFKGKITVLSKEAYPPIDRTKLSKALLTDISKLAWRTEEFLKNELHVDFQTGTEVTKIDHEKRTVTTSDGKTWSYTNIVLATGGTPRELPMPGFKGLGNVFTLRGVSTAKNIVDATSGGKKQVVVIGSSFIGLEVANALSKNHDVTVIGMESAPLERVLGVEVGNKARRILEKAGIKFKLSANVEDAVSSLVAPGKVGGIKLKDGEIIPAEVVILGVGVAPETTYLKNSGWQLEKDGSLVVDKNFAVKGVPNAYAVGDIAKYPYVFLDDAPVRIEHWNVALNAGRAVGRLLAGPSSNAGNTPVEFIPVFWSALGQQVRYCGHPATGFDEVIIKPDGAPDDKFIAYYAKGDKIVAVATIGTDPVMIKAAELLRAYKFPSKTEIQQGVDILALPI
ncbi:rhodocoxin reductase [Exidia glandulosa HHB12029]|uniref:Rhodocoxin reductase n=1 Tax=Exidia glandulosa HHB12029 TaxID=1314781 RepID=A0A165KAJ6_EXIGL|nr:rhodocoxin reductase [Exidia glandulosa HHB12029]